MGSSMFCAAIGTASRGRIPEARSEYEKALEVDEHRVGALVRPVLAKLGAPKRHEAAHENERWPGLETKLRWTGWSSMISGVVSALLLLSAFALGAMPPVPRGIGMGESFTESGCCVVDEASRVRCPNGLRHFLLTLRNR